jgi:hypothetical protein
MAVRWAGVMTDRPDFDPELWFTLARCEGHHYLLGNPHTFPGRMLAWCPQKQRRFFFSSDEVQEASPVARAWIAGFLTGNEPSPPVDDSGEVDFSSDAYADWSDKVARFHLRGHWRDD